jgi:cell volume regulation protein A
MFLTLGLLVNPHELLPIIVPGLIISFMMILFSRPLTVFLCLLPFRKMPLRDKTYVSWVGLRGAVPIIFSIIALASEVPHARVIFNIVFFCTLVSLIVQGTSLPLIARWLNLAEKPKRTKDLRYFDIVFSDDIKSTTTEIEISADMLKSGDHLVDLKLPEKTLVVMIKRKENFFVPTGKTTLQAGDKLLVITDNQEALSETYQKLGVIEK